MKSARESMLCGIKGCGGGKNFATLMSSAKIQVYHFFRRIENIYQNVASEDKPFHELHSNLCLNSCLWPLGPWKVFTLLSPSVFKSVHKMTIA